jgi:carboxymethylenebutenolidase
MIVASVETKQDDSIVNEQNFEITTNDGNMGCFAAYPDKPGPFPAVILYMDAPGIRQELRDFSCRIAEQGYYCLLPDMYYRQGTEQFDLSKGDPGEMKKMFAAMSSLNLELVMADTGSMLQYLDNDERVAGSVGCIGYCMSGQYVVAAAGHYPNEFNAVASLYGVGIVTEKADSPHLLADKIKAELYLGFAETDEYVGDNVIPDLTAALEKHRVEHVIETHEGCHHGFCFPGRGPLYNEAAAEKVWQKVFDLFSRKL